MDPPRFAQGYVMVLLAETNWPDVGLELVKTLAMIVTGVFAIVAASRSGAAKTEAKDAKEAAGQASERAGEAAETATVAAKMSKAAAVHAAESSKRADTQARDIKTVIQQTNGLNERLRQERDEERRAHIETMEQLKAALAALPPEPIANQLAHMAETTDAIADKVGAPKSGVFKRPALPPEASQ